MASQRKRVIVRKFSRDWVAGYADAAFARDQPALEVLESGGKVLTIPWEAVKWVCYVRDFPSGDPGNPERLLQKKFAVRPRTAGLWLRMALMDGDELEGLAANDRSLIEGAGLLIMPPDTRSNTQKIFIPRPSIQSLEVVALIGAARAKRTGVPSEAAQPELFPEPSE